MKAVPWMGIYPKVIVLRCTWYWYLVLGIGAWYLVLYLNGDFTQARLLYLRNLRQPDTVHLGTVAGCFLFLDLSSAAVSTQRFFGLAGVATENKANPEWHNNTSEFHDNLD